MAAVTTIPGTSYRLDGAVLAGELYVSDGGCIYRRVPGGGPGATKISVPIIRADGVRSTYALDGWWKPAAGTEQFCYRKAEPKTHFQRFFGAIQGAGQLVQGSFNATAAEVRAMVAKELPQLEPFIELAKKAAELGLNAAGVDPKMLTGAVLAGAKDAGIPVDTVADLVTAPEATLRNIARNAAIELGIDPALLGLGATPELMRPPQAGNARRRIILAGKCFEADGAGQLTMVDCKSGRPLGQLAAQATPTSDGLSAGHVVLIVIAGAVVAAILYFALKDRGE